MSDKRQKNQLEFAFTDESRSEAPRVSAEGTESLAAKRGTESLAIGKQKWRKSASGTAASRHWFPVYRCELASQALASDPEHLLSGTYQPQPVKRVEIPKPDGGVRKLGIPTVVDRFIQQAVAAAQTYIAEGYRWCVDLDLEKFRSSFTRQTDGKDCRTGQR